MLTVCLPTLNSRAFLEERVNALLAQTFQDFEVVNVDSGSSDGTVEYLRGRFPADRFTTHTRGRGLYESWNECVRLSRGEFLHFATSDDLEDPVFYERMLGVFARNPDAGIVHAHYRVINGEGKAVRRSVRSSWLSMLKGYEPGRVWCHAPAEDFAGSLLLGQSMGPINSLVMRRDVFERTGPWPVGHGPSGDWLWCLRAALKVPVWCVDEELASWRLRRGQATRHYARFDRYAVEAALVAEAVVQALETDLFTPGQRRMLETHLIRARAVAQGKAPRLLRLLAFKPDLPVHALTKLVSSLYAPFPVSRARLKRFLRA